MLNKFDISELSLDEMGVIEEYMIHCEECSWCGECNFKGDDYTHQMRKSGNVYGINNVTMGLEIKFRG